MAYFVLSPSDEEFLSKFLSPDPDPDPDHLSGGLSHRYAYKFLCTKCTNDKSIGAIVFEF